MTSIHPDFYRTSILLLVGARKAANLSQVTLAARLGVRQTFISKIELGERRLDVAEFIVICRAVGTDPYRLLQEAERDVAISPDAQRVDRR